MSKSLSGAAENSGKAKRRQESELYGRLELPIDIRKSIPRDCILLVASDLIGYIFPTAELDAVIPDNYIHDFIDELQDVVRYGTLMFPTFNWDYCKGKAFDIGTTRGRTGRLGEIARKRSDFQRTQHPVYSFAVWGKLKEHLCGLRNKTSFGWDSPFALIDKMLLININEEYSLTFVHHVEQLLSAPWREEKDFGGYSMYVRKAGVLNDLSIFWPKVEKFKLLDMATIFHQIKKDILLNGGYGIHRDGHEELRQTFNELWPYMRSLTGMGSRVTHSILSGIYPLETHEIPTGTKAFDWEVPKEWTFQEAYILGPDGRKWIDARENTLHLVNYSIPFRGKFDVSELMEHLRIGPPEQPDAIPYVTSYYKPEWGFCISWNQFKQMQAGQYEVIVNTELKDGSMTYSDCVLPGESKQEVWFSTYTCHPSMANNELSGPLALIFLLRKLAQIENRRYTYRFIFVPETIGSLAYLAQNETAIKNCIVGYEVTCCGDRAPLQYKRSKFSNSLSDEVAEYVLSGCKVRNYFPDAGADERHYNSPGFGALPIGTIMRSAPGEYPEYHTSLDNKDFISFDNLQETIDKLYKIVEILEINIGYKNLSCYGEPQLSKRGLYGDPQRNAAMRWILAYPYMRLVAIAKKSYIDIDILHEAAIKLKDAKLVEEV